MGRMKLANFVFSVASLLPISVSGCLCVTRRKGSWKNKGVNVLQAPSATCKIIPDDVSTTWGSEVGDFARMITPPAESVKVRFFMTITQNLRLVIQKLQHLSFFHQKLEFLLYGWRGRETFHICPFLY